MGFWQLVNLPLLAELANMISAAWWMGDESKVEPCGSADFSICLVLVLTLIRVYMFSIYLDIFLLYV